MRLYLDDDLASPALARFLRNAGHDVELPADVGLAGKFDAAHLAYAVRQNRVCMSRNYEDFEDLDDLVHVVGGHHTGILVIRRDNNRRNMTARDIVRAIRNLEAAGVPIADEYTILNAWQ